MNLYEIVYDQQRGEGDELQVGRKHQIPATNEHNALVIFGQNKPNSFMIDIVSIKLVRSGY